jgi:sec-independent protein translocase protein TatC
MGATGEAKLTMMEHLDEVRQRILYCVVALVIGIIPCLVFANTIFDLLLIPAPDGFQPVFTEMTEMLFTYFKVALVGGMSLAMPVFIYQVLRFVAPALTSSEKRYMYLVAPAALIFFVAGLAFSYYVLIPFSVKYLLTFSGIAAPMIKIGNYISFITSLLLWVGVAFETPLVMYFLAKLRVVDAKKLGRFRKYAILGVFVVAAIITPTPDPMTQTLVAVPLYLLYELGVLMARFA